MYLTIQSGEIKPKTQQLFAVMQQISLIIAIAFQVKDLDAIGAYLDLVKSDQDNFGRSGDGVAPRLIIGMLEGKAMVVPLSKDGLYYHCHFDQVIERVERSVVLRGIEVINGPHEAMLRHRMFMMGAVKLFDAHVSAPIPV